MKTCSRCKRRKSLAEFYAEARNRDGSASACKGCYRVKEKDYRDKNRKAISARGKKYYSENRVKIRADQRDYRYGLAPGDFNGLFAEQRGLCAICKEVPGGKNGPCVDHDHESGKIRAILCSNCNTSIGLLKESSVLAQQVASYLKQYGK